MNHPSQSCPGTLESGVPSLTVLADIASATTPLSDLDVSHVTIAVDDARHLYAAFDRAEEDHVVANAK